MLLKYIRFKAKTRREALNFGYKDKGRKRHKRSGVEKTGILGKYSTMQNDSKLFGT